MPPPSIQEFEFHERLGKGASGVVYRALRRKDGREVAVKAIDVSDMEPEVRQVSYIRPCCRAACCDEEVGEGYDRCGGRPSVPRVLNRPNTQPF